MLGQAITRMKEGVSLWMREAHMGEQKTKKNENRDSGVSPTKETPPPLTEEPSQCLGMDRTLATGIHLSSLEYLLVSRSSKVGHSPEGSNRVIT